MNGNPTLTQRLFLQMMDAFMEHPVIFLYGVVSFTAIFLLVYDMYKFKNNQVDALVNTRIKKDEKKKEFDITLYFDDFVKKREASITLQLEKANIPFKPKEYLTVMLFGGIIGAIVGLVVFPAPFIWKSIFAFFPYEFTKDIFGRLLAAGVLGFVGTLAPKLWVVREVKKRKKLINEQIEDVLLNMADALKSGHVIHEAIRLVGNDTAYPMGNELQKASREMEAGSTLETALRDLRDRIDIKDFTMAINAIEIQYEVGGKLEPLLRNMSKIISDRKELKKEIEKTIASSRMVGFILLCAPLFFGVTFTLLNKEQYKTMLTMWQGQVLIAVGVVCYFIAAWLIIYIINGVSKDN